MIDATPLPIDLRGYFRVNRLWYFANLIARSYWELLDSRQDLQQSLGVWSDFGVANLEGKEQWKVGLQVRYRMICYGQEWESEQQADFGGRFSLRSI